MTNEIMKVDWKDAAMVATMRDTVAKGATDEEFKLFCAIAQSTGLNPFLRQVWFIKSNPYTNNKGIKVNPPAQIMTGIDGYRVIANTHPAYDGCEIQTDRDKEGRPTRCTAKVYRKDRKYPAIAEVMFREYYKAGYNGKDSTWDKNPSVMIEKVAEGLAVRRAFPLEVGSVRTFEEMGVDETDLTQDEKAGSIDVEIVPDSREFYDLSSLDEKGRGSAQKYLESNFAQWDDEVQVWIAPRKLEKLTGCIIDKAAAYNRARSLDFAEEVETKEQVAEETAQAKMAAIKASILTANEIGDR